MTQRTVATPRDVPSTVIVALIAVAVVFGATALTRGRLRVTMAGVGVDVVSRQGVDELRAELLAFQALVARGWIPAPVGVPDTTEPAAIEGSTTPRVVPEATHDEDEQPLDPPVEAALENFGQVLQAEPLDRKGMLAAARRKVFKSQVRQIAEGRGLIVPPSEVPRSFDADFVMRGGGAIWCVLGTVLRQDSPVEMTWLVEQLEEARTATGARYGLLVIDDTTSLPAIAVARRSISVMDLADFRTLVNEML